MRNDGTLINFEMKWAWKSYHEKLNVENDQEKEILPNLNMMSKPAILINSSMINQVIKDMKTVQAFASFHGKLL